MKTWSQSLSYPLELCFEVLGPRVLKLGPFNGFVSKTPGLGRQFPVVSTQHAPFPLDGDISPSQREIPKDGRVTSPCLYNLSSGI